MRTELRLTPALGVLMRGRSGAKLWGFARNSNRSAYGIAVGFAVAAVSLFSASGAQAQNCTVPSFGAVTDVASIAGISTSIAANIAANIAAANTAFLTQSTAFVGSPANPQPDQQGGGVWARGVGGEVDIKSSSSNLIVAQATGRPTTSANMPCNTKVRSDFDGIQVGADVARLNVNGWNIHFGATAGAIYLNNSVVGGAPAGNPLLGNTQVPFDSSAQVPFIGTYLAVTNGGFFADFLIRADAYQMSLNSPGLNFYDQNVNAHGLSISGSAGYNYQIPDSGGWFIEPSAGLLYSRVKVDQLTMAGGTLTVASVPLLGLVPFSVPGTETFNDITDTIGRLGLRLGKSFSYGNLNVQPFAAVSVWHDFSGNATANWSSCTACLASNGSITSAYSGTNIGTFGQYSLGVSASIADTGWVGFVRGDYRNGPNLNGWDATGGIRYQFTPRQIPVIPVKARPSTVAPPAAVTWAGLYVGAFAGAEEGAAHWGYPGGEVAPKLAGILGGFDLGYNWQNGPWVYGLEGDVSFTDSKGGIACGPVSIDNATLVSSPLFAMTCNARHSWVATITPRLGFTWGRELFYLKGGAAFTHEDFSATCDFGPLNGVNSLISGVAFITGQQCTPVNPSSPFSFSNGFTASSNRAGWTIGFGTEFALTPNWSAKAETDYVDFGNRTLTASDGTALNVGMHMWQAKIGINYHFGGAPVMTQ
jgi:opacity protein-like surface antigen